MKRRDFLQGLGAIPMIGLSGVSNVPEETAKESPVSNRIGSNEKVRLGIIGFGFRGEQLARALKLAHPDWKAEQEKAARKNSLNKTLEDFNKLNDLNIELKAVCDVFDLRVERGIKSAGTGVTGYSRYRDVLNRDDIDAVIIATPDHWHATMAMDAAKSGKHVYLEKCMTRTVEEAIELRDTVKNSGIKFQLGHQGRQNDSNRKANV